MLPLKGETVVAWPRTGLQRSIVAAKLSRTEVVWKHEQPAHRTLATPTDNRIFAPQLRIPDPGTHSDKSRSRRGEAEGGGAVEDRCKGTEQPEGLQGQIASIFAAEAPQGRMRSAKWGFIPSGFPIT